MIKGDHDRLKDLAKWNICAEHKTPLEVAWYGDEKTWVLRCGHDHYPDTITRQLSLTEEYKAGGELPGHIEDKVKKGMRRRAMQQGKQPAAVTFPGVPAADLGTGELLVPEAVKALVDYAHRYGLDPARGHVVLMYGKPYITIDGYLHHARQSKVPYSLQSRPLDDVELKGYRAPENAHVWISKVKMSVTGEEFIGYGVVTQDEITEESRGKPGQLRSPVVAKHPQLLAQKRAEWQTLRRAFPIGGEE
uniref:Uncharacterized protein n=1 Tax=viral metagenome TaxID=1070528 RepID=A0A6M3Y4R2_9ZZZZ